MVVPWSEDAARRHHAYRVSLHTGGTTKRFCVRWNCLSLFFFPLPPPFSFFFSLSGDLLVSFVLSLGVFSWNFGGGTLKYARFRPKEQDWATGEPPRNGQRRPSKSSPAAHAFQGCPPEFRVVLHAVPAAVLHFETYAGQVDGLTHSRHAFGPFSRWRHALGSGSWTSALNTIGQH